MTFSFKPALGALAVMTLLPFGATAEILGGKEPSKKEALDASRSSAKAAGTFGNRRRSIGARSVVQAMPASSRTALGIS